MYQFIMQKLPIKEFTQYYQVWLRWPVWGRYCGAKFCLLASSVAWAIFGQVLESVKNVLNANKIRAYKQGVDYLYLSWTLSIIADIGTYCFGCLEQWYKVVIQKLYSPKLQVNLDENSYNFEQSLVVHNTFGSSVIQK